MNLPSVAPVAERLGMVERGRKHWGPCPACGAGRTRKDRRPPVYIGTTGWRCHACQAKGSAHRLVSYALGMNGALKGSAWRKVSEWMDGSGTLEAEAEAEVLTRIDPSPALRCAVPLSRCRAPAVLAWLARRGIRPEAPAGFLPDFEAAWWPSGYARQWPVVIPACTGRGEVVSMHGMAIQAGPESKTRWPKGASSRELLFAAPQMRQWLRGCAPCPGRLLLVEGAPDFLTTAPLMPTIGFTSGFEEALRLVRVDSGTEVVVGTHLDEAGRRYQDRIANILAPHPVRVLPLERLARTM